MRHKDSSRDQKCISAPATSRIDPEPLIPVEPDFVPSHDEVAHRAYLAYLNQGARPGHEVQRWLAAEAQIIAERNLTRKRGFDIQP